ncbi:LEA type 2 family protein [Roseisolibacter sp. H3M3-2]|uniref:LEA type 2 family protein n=1 Tax=Roseisolibacter sp. H3M3-2 TaxID=3031323 RepID=UPI0023D9E6E8|nr:LEA type 2 family protein [Roseisolibacter sp. H3M3-2]MDF1503036.1 LEA type 2 family protein [Roseisolibacter sp. H3M3-2]
MRRAVVGLTAAALAATAGCASLGRSVFREPVVNFRNVELKGLGVSGGSLDVVLSVYNPNGFNLDATRLTYRLQVDSIDVGTGALDQQFVVQENDSALVRLPISFTYAGLGAAGRQLIQSGSVNYRVLGDVTVKTPLGSFTRPYSGTGRFSALSGTR